MMFRQWTMKLFLALAAFALLVSAALAQSSSVTLRSADGRSVNLAESRGKVVVLSFGATWVPLAAKELPALEKLAERYANRNVSFYWVSINSAKPGAKNYASDAELQAFARRHGLSLMVLRDPDQTAYRAFGLDALPTIVILDREGQVSRKHVGFDPEQIEAYAEVMRSLDQLLK
jgi:peroxiredoxin